MESPSELKANPGQWSPWKRKSSHHRDKRHADRKTPPSFDPQPLTSTQPYSIIMKFLSYRMKEETNIGIAAERLYMEKKQNHPWPQLHTSDFIQMEGIRGGAGDPEGKQPKVPDALSSLVKSFLWRWHNNLRNSRKGNTKPARFDFVLTRGINDLNNNVRQTFLVLKIWSVRGKNKYF